MWVTRLLLRAAPAATSAPTPSPSTLSRRGTAAFRRRLRREGIAFITDAEGNATYFWRCVTRSPVLRQRKSAGGTPVLDFADPSGEAHFVYGGDACDKGPGDMRLVRALLDFKRRYPDRVHLVIGNRDSNKIRLTRELHDTQVQGNADDETETPRWASVSPINMWAQWARRHGEPGRPAKLRWLLTHTMGSPNAFEMRRKELRQMHAPHDDEAVVSSYASGLKEGGYVREYLLNGSLAVHIGDTLFVHGGLSRQNIGFVPSHHVDLDYLVGRPAGEEMPGSRTGCLRTWLERLAEFKRRHLEEWMGGPSLSGGGGGLVAYGYNKFMQGHTVMTESFLTPGGNPQPPCPEVVAFLKANGVRRVVVGHQPHGDCPGVIRHDGVTVIFADTSFSNPLARDNRGVAHASVTLLRGGDAYLSGVLRDGKKFDYALEDYPLVGRPVKYHGTRFWCKAPLPGKRYILSRTCPANRFRLLEKRIHAAKVTEA